MRCLIPVWGTGPGPRIAMRVRRISHNGWTCIAMCGSIPVWGPGSCRRIVMPGCRNGLPGIPVLQFAQVGQASQPGSMTGGGKGGLGVGCRARVLFLSVFAEDLRKKRRRRVFGDGTCAPDIV